MHQGLVQVTIQEIRLIHMLVVVLCRSFPDPLAVVRSLKHISFLISFPHVSFLSRRRSLLAAGLPERHDKMTSRKDVTAEFREVQMLSCNESLVSGLNYCGVIARQ